MLPDCLGDRKDYFMELAFSVLFFDSIDVEIKTSTYPFALITGCLLKKNYLQQTSKGYTTSHLRFFP